MTPQEKKKLKEENLRLQQELNNQLERENRLLNDGRSTEESRARTKSRIVEIEKKLFDLSGGRKKQDDNFLSLEKAITKEKKEQASIGAKTKSLSSQINKLAGSNLGKILKEVALLESLEAANLGARASTGKLQKGYNLVQEAQLRAIEDIKTGTFDAVNFMSDLEEQFDSLGSKAKEALDKMRPGLDGFVKIAKEGGENLENALNIDAKTLDGLENAREKLKEFSAIASSPALMGAFAIGLAVKFITDFAGKALEVRQEFGTTAVDSVKIAGNVEIAAAQAKILGGNIDEARNAAKALITEFGSLDVLTPRVSAQIGSITAQFGVGGENAAKLAKQLSVINGSSLETSLNTIETVGNLARAERVAPAAVLNDLAESTESFAKFSADGGENLARAAIEARKLGLNLATVDKIAESLLDFESSIEKQLEAQVLLGRSLNLDRARELSLAGDLEGLQKEIVNQVGNAEEFNRLNVVQRKALADAIGVEVSELSKLVNKQNEVAAAQEKQVKAASMLGVGIGAIAGLAAAVIPSIIATIPGLAGLSKRQLLKGLGIATLGAGSGAVIGGIVGNQIAKTKAPELQTGGVVQETGMAVVHKGEIFSGTNNEMGFGGTDMTETNKILKDVAKESRSLREQNQFLLNKLIRTTGDMKLQNA